MLRWLAVLSLTLFALPASAGPLSYNDASGGSDTAPGAVQLCLNAAGKAGPCNDPSIAGSGYNVSKPVTPTVQAAAYSASNAIGGLQTIGFSKNAANPSGVLDAALLAFKGGQTAGVTFYVFDKLPTATTCTDRSAFVLGGADVDKLAVAPFVLTPAATQGTTITSAQLVQATSIRNHDTTPTANLYVCAVAGATVTLAVGDFVFKLSGALD